MNLEIAKEVFLEASEILNKFHVKYYLSDGTMLGAIREKDFILWDHDIDLRTPAKNWDFSICKEFERNGFRCRKSIIPMLYNNLPSGFNVYKQGIDFGLGLNYYYPPEDIVVFLAGKPSSCGTLQPAGFYRGNHFIDFLNIKVMIPFPPEDYLESIYGTNWRIPIRNSSWGANRKPISIEKYVEYFHEHPEINGEK